MQFIIYKEFLINKCEKAYELIKCAGNKSLENNFIEHIKHYY